MAKDPATLFYWNDWHTGTMTMTRHQKGCYMDLLAAQFNSGHLSIEQIKIVLGNDFAAWQGSLSKKFATDKDGFFFNERLDVEILKRKKFTTSRRNNLNSKSPTHTGDHMENGNETGNEIDNGIENKGGVGGLPVPTLTDCEAAFQMAGSTREEGEKFFHHYQAQGWKVGNGQPITDWASLAQKWILNQKINSNGAIIKPLNGSKGRDTSYRNLANF